MTTLNLSKLFDELTPTLGSKEPFDVVRHRRSMQLLAVIDALDQRIADKATNKALRRKLLQARSVTAQEFAKHLDADPSQHPLAYFTTDDGRNVWVVLEITGTPSRDGRQEADKWTASRNRPWNGDTNKLRATMRQALRNGDMLPVGRFGLRVVQTIRIGHWSNGDAREFENAQAPLGHDDVPF